LLTYLNIQVDEWLANPCMQATALRCATRRA